MVSKKYLILIAFLCLILAGVVVFWDLNIQTEIKPPVDKEQQTETETETEIETEPEIDLSTKEGLLAVMKDVGQNEDYENFAKYLKMVYQKQWDKEEDFAKAESETYIKVTENYFDKEDVNKALEISDMVYREVPQGWRFRYLRIRCLEKLGREAFEQGDLEKAEEFAMIILQMMYRPEGANLLADIYIQKIEANLAANDKTSALNNLDYIWDYEVSQDRRDKLIELKEQISK